MAAVQTIYDASFMVLLCFKTCTGDITGSGVSSRADGRFIAAACWWMVVILENTTLEYSHSPSEMWKESRYFEYYSCLLMLTCLLGF